MKQELSGTAARSFNEFLLNVTTLLQLNFHEQSHYFGSHRKQSSIVAINGEKSDKHKCSSLLL